MQLLQTIHFDIIPHISDALRYLVPFTQCQKRYKHPWRSESSTLPWIFCFLNLSNGTKSHKVSMICKALRFISCWCAIISRSPFTSDRGCAKVKLWQTPGVCFSWTQFCLLETYLKSSLTHDGCIKNTWRNLFIHKMKTQRQLKMKKLPRQSWPWKKINFFFSSWQKS